MSKLYLMVRHCHFSPDFILDAPLDWFESLYNFWVEENDAVKRRQEKELEEIRNKQKGGNNPFPQMPDLVF